MIIYLTFITSLYFIYRNKIDLYLLFFMSNVFYGSHIIYGLVVIPPHTREVNDNAKIILMIILAGVSIFTLIVDQIETRNYNKIFIRKNINKSKKHAKIILIISLILFAIVLYYSISKRMIAKADLKFYIPSIVLGLFFYFSALSFISSFFIGNKMYIFLSGIQLVFYYKLLVLVFIQY